MKTRVEKVLGLCCATITRNVMVMMATSVEDYHPLNLRYLTEIVYGLDVFPKCPNVFQEAKKMFKETTDEILKVFPDYEGEDIEIFVASVLLLKIYLLAPELSDGSNFEKVLEAAEKIQNK